MRGLCGLNWRPLPKNKSSNCNFGVEDPQGVFEQFRFGLKAPRSFRRLCGLNWRHPHFCFEQLRFGVEALHGVFEQLRFGLEAPKEFSRTLRFELEAPQRFVEQWVDGADGWGMGGGGGGERCIIDSILS